MSEPNADYGGYWPNHSAEVQKRNSRWMASALEAEGLTTVEDETAPVAGYFCLATIGLAPCLNGYGECGQCGSAVVPLWAIGTTAPTGSDG